MKRVLLTFIISLCLLVSISNSTIHATSPIERLGKDILSICFSFLPLCGLQITDIRLVSRFFNNIVQNVDLMRNFFLRRDSWLLFHLIYTSYPNHEIVKFIELDNFEIMGHNMLNFREFEKIMKEKKQLFFALLEYLLYPFSNSE